MVGNSGGQNVGEGCISVYIEAVTLKKIHQNILTTALVFAFQPKQNKGECLKKHNTVTYNQFHFEVRRFDCTR